MFEGNGWKGIELEGKGVELEGRSKEGNEGENEGWMEERKDESCTIMALVVPNSVKWFFNLRTLPEKRGEKVRFSI